MARHCEASARLFVDQDVLCLTEVGGITLTIESTNNEATSHTPSVLARDQNKGCRGVNGLNGYEAINDRNSKWRVFDRDELLQHLVVEGELVDVIDAVRVHTKEIRPLTTALASSTAANKFLKRALNALRQIERVAEVEATIVLECLKHRDEFLILLGYDNRHYRVGQWDIHELLD